MKIISIIMFVMLCILQYRLWFGSGGIPQVRELESVQHDIQLENERLKERNRTLSAEVMDLKQGLQAIEERARNEMGMIKENETFYQIVKRQNLPEDSIQEK